MGFASISLQKENHMAIQRKTSQEKPLKANFRNLYPYISMHILHTVLYTFPEVLTVRTC